jgi:hypothetical protein
VNRRAHPDLLDTETSDGGDRQRREKASPVVPAASTRKRVSTVVFRDTMPDVYVRDASRYARRRGRKVMFTSIDYDKFRSPGVTHVAARLEELIQDETNDTLTPEQLFLTAVDDALESRRINKVDKTDPPGRLPDPGSDRRRGRLPRRTRHHPGQDATLCRT